MLSFRALIGAQLIVTFDDAIVRGTLHDCSRKTLVLRDATALGKNAETPIVGQLWVQVAHVVCVQTLEA